MKLHHTFPFLLLLAFFACDPNGKENNTENKDSIEGTSKEALNDSEAGQNSNSNIEKEDSLKDDEIMEEKPDHFICFTNDSNPNMAISISYTEDEKAMSVKYKGQKESMKLSFIKEQAVGGGINPTIETYYSEMHEGKENGVYKLTHSGIWDYAEYTRGRDKKVFNFTIDHELSDENGAYRSSPCF